MTKPLSPIAAVEAVPEDRVITLRWRPDGRVTVLVLRGNRVDSSYMPVSVDRLLKKVLPQIVAEAVSAIPAELGCRSDPA